MTLVSIARVSRVKERAVKILAGFRKPSGNIHALIENDKKELYRVTLFANGTSSCRHEVNGKHEGCPSRGRMCYHIEAVLLVASLFTEDGIMEKHEAPRSMQYLYFDDVHVAAASGDKSFEEALSEAYDALGATKKVSQPSIAESLSARGLMRGQRQSYCGGQRIA